MYLVSGYVGCRVLAHMAFADLVILFHSMVCKTEHQSA